MDTIVRGSPVQAAAASPPRLPRWTSDVRVGWGGLGARQPVSNGPWA